MNSTPPTPPLIPHIELSGRPNCSVRFLPPNQEGLRRAVFLYKGCSVAVLDEKKTPEEIMADARAFAERMNYK